MELEGIALFLGEGRALIEVGRSQQCIALDKFRRISCFKDFSCTLTVNVVS